MIARETIFNALFALAGEVTWGEPPAGFAYLARRVKLWGDLAAQPALCQAEHDRNHPRRRQRTWKVRRSCRQVG